MCFKYSVTAALNHQKIEKKKPQRISKIRLYINQYEWKERNFPIGLKD